MRAITDNVTVRPPIAPALFYRDAKAALLWLEQAFGFEPLMVLLTPDDELAHAEMRFGDGLIMVGSEWSEELKSPLSLGGMTTQAIHVHLPPDQQGGVDGHCQRARDADARILMEPTDQFYG